MPHFTRTSLSALFFLVICTFGYTQDSTGIQPSAPDSLFIYELPYRPGDRHYLIQGSYTLWSHKNMNALDFTMKKGTMVTAARGGVVTGIKQDGEKHGVLYKFADHGNYVSIRHEDGTTADYWHIMKNGALVHIGDTVKTGQPIALSGHTGYSAMPHLHFEVWNYDPKGNYCTYPALFNTEKGVMYLKPTRHYRRIKFRKAGSK